MHSKGNVKHFIIITSFIFLNLAEYWRARIILIKTIILNQYLHQSVSLHTVCHEAVYFEYTFNLTHFLQSRDRIHRLGIPNSIETNYYFVACNDSDNDIYRPIDVKTLLRLKDKEDRMIRAVESKQFYIKSTSFEEDIKYIFDK